MTLTEFAPCCLPVTLPGNGFFTQGLYAIYVFAFGAMVQNGLVSCRFGQYQVFTISKSTMMSIMASWPCVLLL